MGSTGPAKREQPEDQLGALIATVRALLEQGLMLLGDLAAGPFEPWSGPTTQQFSRLEREWRRCGDDALLGIWLQNTPAGTRFASAESVDSEG